ncbi:mannose-1-phosphate guanylyltransferase/mannose-6-phosphate isomerase [Massilia sp. LjRoot122]|uniref:mannose-1-phosphate guanylyltransferase/mannose-6-phosphate isomerase n=1 Tax=Massilia sp. LjRoot122 TaxID=3342257 RepID=UPI003ECC7A72
MKICPVILSGGVGTRLWPLSRAVMPKQLLPLVTDKTMLQETALRVHDCQRFTAPLVVCGNEHRFLVAEQLREVGIAPQGILLEPVGRNTAPAIATAALYLHAQDPDAIMLVLPADHVIEKNDAFLRSVDRAAALVQNGSLVTFGIVPNSPDTGYGYIQRGQLIGGSADSYRIERFVEKPDHNTAEGFLSAGGYYWNSGMFMFRADRFLAEIAQHAPAIAEATKLAMQSAYRDLDFCRLDGAAFAACPSNSIDYAVMEHTSSGVVIAADIGWSDVGSWAALADVQCADADGNVQRGDVYLDGVSNTLVRAESRVVAVVGVKDLVVVETPDAVLVSHKDHVQRVKNVVEHLKVNERTEHVHHTRVYRPWGHYEGIDAGDRFQVKRITVKPGEKLSLQMHHHRAEHWIVVSGTALVTCGDKMSLLSENESTYIPIGMTHRLENPGKLPLHLIEVQSGSYLGEDDIVRFEDIYLRT